MEAIPRVRTVICTALIVYCAGVFTLSVWPTEDFSLVKGICAALAVFATIGLLAYMSRGFNLPGQDLAYLITGMVGATVFGVYVIHSNDSKWEQATIGLLLASGAIVGYGAYLAEARYGDGDG